MKLSELSLSAKLTLSFIAFLVIPLISGLLAYYSVSQVQSFNRQIVDQMEIELRVDRVTAGFHEAVIAAHNYLKNADPKEHSNYHKTRKKLDEDYNNALNVLPPADKKTLSKIKVHTARMDALADKVFAVANPVGNPQVALLIEDFDASSIKGEIITSEVRERIDDRLQSMFMKANATQRGLVERLIVSGLFLLLGPLIFWFAGRSISASIYSLIGEAKRLCEGDWDTPVKAQAGAEFTALRDTLEEMRRNLVKYRQEVANYQTTLEKEIELLQTALLPSEIPKVKGLEVATFYSSATKGLSIGGDFYDFIPLGSQRFGFVVGDVSGRGVEAATHTVLCRFSLRSFALENPNPDKVLERLNKVLIPQTSAGRFITIWYGVWDPANQTITYSNGGHLFPLLVNPLNGEVWPIPGSDIAIGVWKDSVYEKRVVQLTKGEMLIAYTDGLVEARSKSGEFLGEERLIEKIKGLIGKSAESVAQTLGSFCLEWTSGELVDDVEIMVLKVM